MSAHATVTMFDRVGTNESRITANETRIAELEEEIAVLRKALRHLASGHRVGALAESILDECP